MSLLPGLEMHTFTVINPLDNNARVYVHYCFQEMRGWTLDQWDEFYGLFLGTTDPNSAEFEGWLARQMFDLPGNGSAYDIEKVRHSFWLPQTPGVDDGEFIPEHGGQILELTVDLESGNGTDLRHDLEAFFQSFTMIKIGGVESRAFFLPLNEEVVTPGEFFRFYATHCKMPGDLVARWVAEGSDLPGTMTDIPVGA